MRKHQNANAYNLMRTEQMFQRLYVSEDWSARRGRCAYCTAKMSREDATGDHRVARKHGGSVNRENIKAVCKPCNAAKGTMSEAAFKAMLRSSFPPPYGEAKLCAWIRHRLEKATRKSLLRICRYAGLPDEAAA